MKALGWALAASMAVHALLLLFCPFPETVGPQLTGRSAAVIVALSANHPTKQRETNPASHDALSSPPYKTERKSGHKNAAPPKSEVPPAAKGSNRSDASSADKGNTTPKTVPRTKPATRDQLRKADASKRTAASAAEPTPSSEMTSTEAVKPPEDTRYPVAKPGSVADSRAKPSETAAAGQRNEGKDSAEASGSAVIQAVPLYRQNTPPAYPRRARLRGHEGQVVFDVLVGDKGEVLDLKIFRSSGHSLLDRAALEAVRNWRFEPARLGSKPITMWVKVPVRFKLE